MVSIVVEREKKKRMKKEESIVRGDDDCVEGRESRRSVRAQTFLTPTTLADERSAKPY